MDYLFWLMLTTLVTPPGFEWRYSTDSMSWIIGWQEATGEFFPVWFITKEMLLLVEPRVTHIIFEGVITNIQTRYPNRVNY